MFVLFNSSDKLVCFGGDHVKWLFRLWSYTASHCMAQMFKI